MRARAAAVVVLVVLAGCGPGPAADRSAAPEAGSAARATSSPSPSATASATHTPTPSTSPTPSPTPTTTAVEWHDVPDELASVMPSQEEMDQLADGAEEAYRDHLARYDAAIAGGFRDEDLVAELLAGTGWRTREAIERDVDVVAEAGYHAVSESHVVGIEPFGLSLPGPDWPGRSLAFEVCLRNRGTMFDGDGTELGELWTGEPTYVHARLMEHDGGWLLMEQAAQEGPCSEYLS